MNSNCVACGLAFLANRAHLSCIAIYYVMRGLCLLNLDGGRNNGKPYFYSTTLVQVRSHQLAALRNRKIRLLTRTHRQSAPRCEIYVLRVCPTLTIFVDDFVAKFLWQKLVQPGPILLKLHLTIKHERQT